MDRCLLQPHYITAHMSCVNIHTATLMSSVHNYHRPYEQCKLSHHHPYEQRVRFITTLMSSVFNSFYHHPYEQNVYFFSLP